MSKRTYNADTLKIMFLFEKITRTRLKDCFTDDNDLLTFVVHAQEIGKAIGKKASNVKKLEMLMKRKIKIIAYSESAVEFVKNLIYPVSNTEIEEESGVITITSQDSKTKSYLIGRNRSNLNNYLKIVQKYFKEISEIKIA